VLLVALAGCAHRPGVPDRPSDVSGYHKAPPGLAGVDPSPLRGRRVVVDPGHGGFFRGAVGDGGLTEAEVNLGVALYLQGLLQWAGADVHLTRTVDTDFLSPADSSLAADLAARVAICDSLQPDVFVSIHHNSTASRDPDVNETQTYYPLGREGADRDLALAIHRQLVRALEIEPARILPGGFHVLRHAPVPAVLGEPAMISNPVIEGRLGLARSLELEAQAYFLGLRDYFAAGSPRWATDLPDTLVVDETSQLAWTFDPGAPGAPGLDPATLRVDVGGAPVTPRLTPAGDTVLLRPDDLAGHATISLHARNLAGRATTARRHVVLTAPPRTGSARAIRDAAGRALFTYALDGVDFARHGPYVLGRADGGSVDRLLPPGRRDRGWLLLDGAPADLATLVIKEARGDSTTVIAGTAPTVSSLPPDWSWRMLRAPAGAWPRRDVPGRGWRLRAPSPRWAGSIAAYARSGVAPDWPAVPARRDAPLWLEADGARPLLLDAAGNPPWPDSTTGRSDTLTWRPLLPALVGRRVALDPRGGGSDEQGRGPHGTRGSDLNLRLAERLANLLRGVGCEVLLVRDDDLHTPDPARVQRADDFAAEFYLAIARGGPGVRHHPGSQIGRPLAERCAASLADLLTAPVPVAAAHDYVLRHTACPAVVVALETLDGPGTADRLASPAWQDAVARSLLRAVVSLLAADTPFVAPSDLLTALGPRAIALDRLDHLRLDGNLPWLPPAGHPSATAVPSWAGGDPGLPAAGPHHVVELHAGPHWQVWTLTRSPAGSWQGRIFLESR
jgi:N-acetylmuramoyl-L-alanine amidase